MGFLKAFLPGRCPSYTNTFVVDKPFEEASPVIGDLTGKCQGLPGFHPHLSITQTSVSAIYKATAVDDPMQIILNVVVSRTQDNKTSVTATWNDPENKKADIKWENWKTKVLKQLS